MNRISHRVYVNKPLPEVFDSLADGKVWNAWFTTDCSIGSKPGDPVKFVWKDFGIDHESISDQGRIVEFKRPTRLSFTWSPGASVTTVTFSLSPRGEGTIVTLEDRGYTNSAADHQAYAGCSTGWGEALTLFKFYLEHKVTYGAIPRKAVERPESNGIA